MTIRLFERNRGHPLLQLCTLFVFVLSCCLSLRNTSKALSIFKDEKRSYVSVWNWIQRFGSYHIYKRRRVSAFVIDETVIQVGDHNFWLWICIEPVHKSVLGIYISQKKETSLQLKISLDHQLNNMVDIQFTLMMVLGILKHASFCI